MLSSRKSSFLRETPMSNTAATQLPTPTITYATGVTLVLLAGVFWSSIGIGVRSIEYANVWQILVYRSFALAVFLFVLISVRSGFRPFAVVRKSGIAGVIGALGLVVAFSGGIYSIQTTTVANAMFLFASAPFLAAVFGWIFLRESVRKETWIATAVAMVGITIMVLDGFAIGQVWGNLAALLSAVGFAVFTISLRWKKLNDMFPCVLLAGVFACLIATAICMLQDYPLLLTANDTAIALAMGIFQVGVGLTIYTIGSKVVPAGELALLSMTEVLLGPFWVWLLLGETVSGYTLTGGAVLLSAIAGNALSGLRRKPVPVM